MQGLQNPSLVSSAPLPRHRHPRNHSVSACDWASSVNLRILPRPIVTGTWSSAGTAPGPRRPDLQGHTHLHWARRVAAPAPWNPHRPAAQPAGLPSRLHSARLLGGGS